MKKVFLFLLCFVFAFSISGCGTDGTRNIDANEGQVQEEHLNSVQDEPSFDENFHDLPNENKNDTNSSNNQIASGDEADNEQKDEGYGLDDQDQENQEENLEDTELDQNGFDENVNNDNENVVEQEDALVGNSDGSIGNEEDNNQVVDDEDKGNQKDENNSLDNGAPDENFEENQNKIDIETLQNEIKAFFEIELNFVGVTKIEEAEIDSQGCAAVLNLETEYSELSTNLQKQMEEKYSNNILFIFTDASSFLTLLKLNDINITVSLVCSTQKSCSLTIVIS